MNFMTNTEFANALNEYNISFEPFTTKEKVIKAEKIIGIPFGSQLKDYLLKYSNLEYNDVHFFGINLKETTQLYRNFSLQKKYIVFCINEYRNYILLDSKDNMYEFDTEKREVNSLHIKLFDYIVKKIEEEAMTYVAVVNMAKVNNQNNCRVPDLGITCNGKDLFDCLYHAEQEILAVAEKRKLQNIKMPKPTLQKDIICNKNEIKVSIVVSTEKMGDNNANTLPK